MNGLGMDAELKGNNTWLGEDLTIELLHLQNRIRKEEQPIQEKARLNSSCRG
jgi:hypothetical protein